MRKSFLFGLSAAVLTLASWSVSLPASAQGVVPASTLTAPKGTAPGATAKGIKDSKLKGCGSCGLTGGRVKNEGGPGGGPRVTGRKFNDSWNGAN
jgi:hypothetical protein